MKLLKTIYRQEDLDLSGKTLQREAVRGIISKGNQVYMLYSHKKGDYKFPGGGVEPGETYKQALIREIKEECGALVSQVEAKIGKVIEYKKAKEEEYDIFKMTSFYYMCNIEEKYCSQKLEPYEKDFEFQPVWVKIDDAYRNNKMLIEKSEEKYLGWILRETYVLSQLAGTG